MFVPSGGPGLRWVQPDWLNSAGMACLVSRVVGGEGAVTRAAGIIITGRYTPSLRYRAPSLPSCLQPWAGFFLLFIFFVFAYDYWKSLSLSRLVRFIRTHSLSPCYSGINLLLRLIRSHSLSLHVLMTTRTHSLSPFPWPLPQLIVLSADCR